ncbi:ankyrin repeat-containing domain protein [Podospora didyma]|uniref:Ankyrin repeat-containing domain protein n=1 Tax=Podospora didyma TaxID=330526 RepID=A0AAE0NTA2_9PEZI|nr:ankyrin repeat-containing domain protein [Podospora didyma]
MEAVAVAVSVISLAKATRTLRNWIGHTIHLAEHIGALHSELESFDILVQGLRHASGAGGLSSGALHGQAATAISDAERTINNIKTLLLQARHGSAWSAPRLCYVLRESTCTEIRRKIQRHTSALTGIMLVAIHHAGEQRHAQLLQCLPSSSTSSSPSSSNDTFIAPITDYDPNTSSDTLSLPQLLSTFPSNNENSRRPSSTTLFGNDDDEGFEEKEQVFSSKLEGRSKSLSLQRVTADPKEANMRRKSAPSILVHDNTNTMKTSLRNGLFRKLFNLILNPTTERIVPESSEGVRVASTGSAAELLALFKSGAVFPTDRTADGWTLLMNATYYGKLEVVELLAKNKRALAARDEFGRQAAHLAWVRSFNVNANTLDYQRLLAFPNWRDSGEEFEFTPIHAAVLGAYPPGNRERPSLDDLVHFSHDLNNLPPNPSWKKLKLTYRGRSPLYTQIIDLFSHAECEQRQKLGSAFRKVYLDLLNVPDALQGWTPFHWATYAGQAESLRSLLGHGADPFLLTPQGRSALHYAAESMQQPILDILLSIPQFPTNSDVEREEGGWFDINLQDAWGETPLHIAVYRQSPSLVRRLLDHGARRDLPTTEGRYLPLHYAANLASSKCQNELVRMLSVDGGYHINEPDENGCPPLFALLGNSTAVQTLLDAGAELSVLDKDGASVLHHACAAGYVEALELLLACPSMPNNLPMLPNRHGDIPLALAIRNRSTNAAKIMLERYGPGDSTFKDGRSLLHRAVEAGDADFLLACFRHPTFRRGVRTKEGWTTKELASRLGKFDGRMREMILRYEGYGAGAEASRGDPEVVFSSNRVMAEYFALK